MSKTFVIEPSKCLVWEEDAKEYIQLLNGVSKEIWEGHGYKTGWRNELIVNMTVAAYELGLNPYEVLNEFKLCDLIRDEDDDEYPSDRMQRVLEYTDRYDWDWMIDPDYYLMIGKNLSDDYLHEELPISFV